MSPDGKERRSGKGRRMVDQPVCTVPCKPINDKLDRMVEKRLFFWCVGGLAFFTIIVIGGAQWQIVDKVNRIDTNVQVMSVTVNSTAIQLTEQIANAELKNMRMDGRLDNIEKGETFYNFYNRELQPHP